MESSGNLSHIKSCILVAKTVETGYNNGSDEESEAQF